MFLSSEEYKKVSSKNSVKVEMLEENGEIRYKIDTIIG